MLGLHMIQQLMFINILILQCMIILWVKAWMYAIKKFIIGLENSQAEVMAKFITAEAGVLLNPPKCEMHAITAKDF